MTQQSPAAQAAAAPGVAALPAQGWQRSRHAIHATTQMLGKIALAASYFRNHWWNCALELTVTGLRTPLLCADPTEPEAVWFDIDFDLIFGVLTVRSPRRRSTLVLLDSQTIAGLYADLMRTLAEHGVSIRIDPIPAEVSDPVAFDADDAPLRIDTSAARSWLQQLHIVSFAFDRLVTDYYGKTSGSRFYWGALDLAISLYNGKPATTPPQADRIYRFAENAENITFSYWVDGDGVGELCAYRYPGSERDAHGNYGAGSWVPDRGEVVCDLSPASPLIGDPDAIYAFLRQTVTTLGAAGDWDLPSLLGPVPPGVGDGAATGPTGAPGPAESTGSTNPTPTPSAGSDA